MQDAIDNELYKIHKAHEDEMDRVCKKHAAEIDAIRSVHEQDVMIKNDLIQKMQDAHNQEVDRLCRTHAEELNRPIEDRVNETLITYYEWYTRELEGFKKEAEAYEAEFKKLKFTRAAIIGATMAIIIAAIAFCSESLIDYLPLMTIMAVPTLIFSYFCNKPEGKKIKSRRRA